MDEIEYNYWVIARQNSIEEMQEHTRPSVLFRPALTRDGDRYCALYGENLQEGCAGFGKSPDDAMRNFDKNWMERMKV